MQNTEQIISRALQGTFVKWYPTRGTFELKFVPPDFMPTHDSESFYNRAPKNGATARKPKATPEVHADARRYLRNGMSAGGAAKRIYAEHNITLHAAESAVREARKTIYG